MPNITLSAATQHLAHLIHAMQRTRSIAAESGLTGAHAPILSAEGDSDLLTLQDLHDRAVNGRLEPSGFWNGVAIVQGRYPALNVHLFDRDHHFLPLQPGAMLLPWADESA